MITTRVSFSAKKPQYPTHTTGGWDIYPHGVPPTMKPVEDRFNRTKKRPVDRAALIAQAHLDGQIQPDGQGFY